MTHKNHHGAADETEKNGRNMPGLGFCNLNYKRAVETSIKVIATRTLSVIYIYTHSTQHTQMAFPGVRSFYSLCLPDVFFYYFFFFVNYGVDLYYFYFFSMRLASKLILYNCTPLASRYSYTKVKTNNVWHCQPLQVSPDRI